jgi:tryptophanyl-tRNA synthetase
MSIVTDSSGDKPMNVYNIHKAVRDEGEIETVYEMHKGKYKNLKEALIEDIEAMIAPMREIYESMTDADVRKVLEDGSDRARAIASKKMQAVRDAVGLSI